MFQPDGDREEIERYDDVVVSLETGTDDWHIEDNKPEPAVRIRIDRDGRFDPMSSSTVPVKYLPQVLEAALTYLQRRPEGS